LTARGLSPFSSFREAENYLPFFASFAASREKKEIWITRSREGREEEKRIPAFAGMTKG
jgi:hypothetical protein